MTDQEYIKELELQVRVKDRLINTLKELAIKQKQTIDELRDRIASLTPDITA